MPLFAGYSLVGIRGNLAGQTENDTSTAAWVGIDN